MALFNFSIILLLNGYLFLGISHVAFLPPWEGFDETAHFSYIQQIADTGSLPKQNRAKISKEVEEYKKGGLTYIYHPINQDDIGRALDITGKHNIHHCTIQFFLPFT
jgi:hypothetical protein